jgi:purine-binding chemotaxis protein CheW
MAETAENEIIDERQYIVVKLGEEQFGIDIKYVDNIVRMQRITRVPKAQHYFKGVINLRGEVIPVMSLRLKFGLEDEEYKNSTRIIIIKLEPQSAIGVIVDEVREVVNLSSDNIEKVQYDANGANDDKLKYLNGIGKHNNGLISILNIANVIIEKEEKAM